MTVVRFAIARLPFFFWLLFPWLLLASPGLLLALPTLLGPPWLPVAPPAPPGSAKLFGTRPSGESNRGLPTVTLA